MFCILREEALIQEAKERINRGTISCRSGRENQEVQGGPGRLAGGEEGSNRSSSLSKEGLEGSLEDQLCNIVAAGQPEELSIE